VDPLHVPLAAAALLLAPSGARKVRDPAPTHRALRIVGLPSSPLAVRLLGAVELAIGAGVLLSSSRLWAGALAVVYVEFTAFVALALFRNAPLESCGCFGAADSPPSIAHVAIDAGLATVAVIVTVDPIAAPIDVVRDGGGDAFALVAGAVAIALSIYWVLSRPARTRATPTRLNPR
jgi:hypothetical protein